MAQATSVQTVIKGVNVARVVVAAVTGPGGKPGVIGAEAVPVHPAHLQVAGEYPGPHLHVEARVRQQVLRRTNDAEANQLRHVMAVNLHHAVIEPEPGTVVIHYACPQAAFVNSDSLEQQRVNMVSLPGTGEAVRLSLPGAQADHRQYQKIQSSHKGFIFVDR